jgi:hypothetical protein
VCVQIECLFICVTVLLLVSVSVAVAVAVAVCVCAVSVCRCLWFCLCVCVCVCVSVGVHTINCCIPPASTYIQSHTHTHIHTHTHTQNTHTLICKEYTQTWTRKGRGMCFKRSSSTCYFVESRATLCLRPTLEQGNSLSADRLSVCVCAVCACVCAFYVFMFQDSLVLILIYTEHLRLDKHHLLIIHILYRTPSTCAYAS